MTEAIVMHPIAAVLAVVCLAPVTANYCVHCSLHNYTTTNRISTATSDLNMQECCLKGLHTLNANVL